MSSYKSGLYGNIPVLDIVGLIGCLSADLAGDWPNERDSDETYDFSARKSSVTKRYRASISDDPAGHLRVVFCGSEKTVEYPQPI